VYGAVRSRLIDASGDGRCDILVVCTGNIARSAMAEAMLRARLAGRALEVRVRSAGLGGGGAGGGGRPGSPPTPVVDAMREYGLDLSAHASQPVTGALVADADLVLGMTREHVWGVLAHDPEATPRTFLMAELARLGPEVGPRRPAELPRAWVARVAARRPAGRAFGRADDAIADPLGEPTEVVRATAARLDAAAQTIAALLAPDL
jgi:protein-tyrosine phosphatase